MSFSGASRVQKRVGSERVGGEAGGGGRQLNNRGGLGFHWGEGGGLRWYLGLYGAVTYTANLLASGMGDNTVERENSSRDVPVAVSCVL